MMRKKIYIVCFFSIVVLIATMLTEHLFYRQDSTHWINVLEERLHNQETKADEILTILPDSLHFHAVEWDDEISFLVFRQGELVFWTHELGEIENLYARLKEERGVIKLGNTYYDVRHRLQGGADYYALIRIVDLYPYTTKYVKNRFADYLKISEQDLDQFTISLENLKGGELIKNKEGKELFTLFLDEDYKEWAPKYFLISLYLLVFLSLFYLFDKILKSTTLWRKQLLWFIGFVGLLFGLRCLMQAYHLPPVIYRLPIFEEKFAEQFFITSIGDLLLMTFSFFQLVYITISNAHLNYAHPFFKRYRYLIALCCFSFVYLYVMFFNFSVSLVMEYMDIHLNIAQLFGVGIGSILAFVAINFGGLIILILLFGTISLLHHLLSFKQTCWVALLISGTFCIVGGLWDLHLDYRHVGFIFVATILLAINHYLLKSDIQRGVYILVVFLQCIYIVLLSREYEYDKELHQQMLYATELLEERDYNFEKQLLEFDTVILQSSELLRIVKTADEVKIQTFMEDTLLDMTGYKYEMNLKVNQSFRDETNTNVPMDWKQWEQLIRGQGVQIGDSHFYAINQFDGLVTYIGRFPFDNNYLYLSFEAKQEEEGVGYDQILSRKSESVNQRLYFYSYAKYAQGNLVASHGHFVYYKKLSGWGDLSANETMVLTKNQYLHILLPVDDDSALVISTPESSSGLYYMNVLYAFIVCILLSTHGLFFRVNHNIPSRKGTLRGRIKNNVIGLMVLLLLILTVLSIYMNTKSFENRHRAEVVRFLKYVHEELEGVESEDWRQSSYITEKLSEISELLSVDINIYSNQGELVTTSRPEIFEAGFDGVLMNPIAWRQIVKEKATNYIEQERVGELSYMSAYMPLVLNHGDSYILNVPYFTQNDELKLDILIMVVIAMNVAIIMIVLAFILSGLIAEQVTKPLQMVNEKFRKMQIGGKNEKIKYQYKDEIELLIQEYNNMVDKLEESVAQLARSEREYAWREMARQIAHEIKNPLTPMKLNIQFLLRSLEVEDSQKFEERFRKVSALLMEQIDNMAKTASAFSDFAKMSESHQEVFALEELVKNCTELFRTNVDSLRCEWDNNLQVLGDKEQLRRVIINLLKNAEQSIPQDRESCIWVSVRQTQNQIELRVRDNGCGIPPEIEKKIFEPNFTTKSSGSGLGLAICRKIIEEQRGEIRFTTELEVGTEFLVILPKYVG